MSDCPVISQETTIAPVNQISRKWAATCFALVSLTLVLASCYLPRPPVEVSVVGDRALTYPQEAQLEVVVSRVADDQTIWITWSAADANSGTSIVSPDSFTTRVKFPGPGTYEITVEVEVDGEPHTAIHTVEVLEAGKHQVIGLNHTSYIATGFHEETGDPYPVPSTDPAGLVHFPPTGNFLIADSEINEIPSVMEVVGRNLFEVDLAANRVEHSWYLGPEDEDDYPNLEPTGIAYFPLDEHIYVTNDDLDHVARYEWSEGNLEVVDYVSTRPHSGDPEGITCDPDTGYLYVIAGSGARILVYVYRDAFILKDVLELPLLVTDPAGVPSDPEGIAFDPISRHLFVISDPDAAIFEYTVTGDFIRRFDVLRGLTPKAVGAQGLAFGPSTQDPGALSLYLADGGYDTDSVPDARDGFIFEFAVERSE